MTDIPLIGGPDARTPTRQIRASYDDSTITVYQAYSSAIAVPAAAGNSFVGTPFKLERMTWVKPSFLWMMYRSGWATKPGQEHVLGIRMTRSGFEQALSVACLSHFDPQIHPDLAAWRGSARTSPVRVQWDPERDRFLEPLPWRSLQLGLSREATISYRDDWVVGIQDITATVRELQREVEVARNEDAPAGLPEERVYPLPAAIADALGVTR